MTGLDVRKPGGNRAFADYRTDDKANCAAPRAAEQADCAACERIEGATR